MTSAEAISAIKARCHYCDFFPKCVFVKPECYHAAAKAIKALEQPKITLESAIDYLHSIGWMQEHDRALTESARSEPEIVRCKDCKYRPISRNGFTQGFNIDFPNEYENPCPCKCDDGWYSWMPDNDWFCAEGKRKGEQE